MISRAVKGAQTAAVLVRAAGRYGYHRDELYFLACGRRLAWGYPDQPPLTPLLARASELVLAHSSVALRAPAVALCVGATLLAALIARDLGGGPFARGLLGAGARVAGTARLAAIHPRRPDPRRVRTAGQAPGVLPRARRPVQQVPVALPVLSPSTLDRTPWAALSEPQREMVGWPSLVDRVAVAYASFPAAQRARTVVVTSNYGEAGAVEEYGPARGVPRPAYSGHNGFAAWGPPPQDDAPAVVVHQSDPPGSPPPGFTGCRSFGRIVTGVHNEESQSATVWACAGVAGGWRAAWPYLTHLSA